MAFPFIKQFDAKDCGPACLCMIAKYYGKSYTQEYLRKLMFIGRDGVSLLGITKAAEKLGFKTVGGRFTFDRVAEKALFPCIAHWEQDHFVIITGIKKKRNGETIVSVVDPGKGYLSYSKEDFCDHWVSTQVAGEEKGVIVILEPTHLFYDQTVDQPPKRSRLNFLSNYLIKYKKFFSQLLLGVLIGSILQLTFPFLTQAIVDIGIYGRDISFIWLILIAQLMLLFSRTAIDFIRVKILLHISTRINISLISDFFIKLMKLPMVFFDNKLTGDLLQRIEDHRRIETFITAQSLNLLFSVFSFLVFGVVLFIYNLKIFLVFVAGSLIYGLWIRIFLKKRQILDYQLFEHQAINRNVVYQLITGMQEIKLQGCEQRKRWEWEDVQANLFDVNLKSLNLQQNQEAGSVLINELKNTIITVLAATSVLNGELTVGMMLAIQYIIGQLNSPVEQIMGFIYKWQDVSISIDRMNEIHTQKNEENENRDICELNPQHASIHLENVCFKYNENSPEYILNNINLHIPEGKVTAIVGASGSGKTTLIKLLLGYYEPHTGTIKIGNTDLVKMNLSWWRTMCGAVMQEGYVFSDSIARNIAVSDDVPDLDKIRYAANIANIAGHIEMLPLAYNTMIGQDGQGISQGQKQRVLLARVVYKNPAYVFLDEATNALDANNEKAIIENLSTFYRGKTVVIVAHRLSTVKNADQIVVLDKGRIQETGTHEELTNKRSLYYELVKNQLELGK